MSYPNISGLDLFQMPFGSPQASGQSTTDLQPEPSATQPKTPVPEPKAPAEAAASEREKTKAHEAEEKAGQPAKKQEEEAELQKLQNMGDDEAVSASIGRVRADMERITRRNMKECVAGHIQDLCRKDPAFARKTLHPRKSMANCFKYINRMAKEYARQEMEANDLRPENGIYGCDVPDGLCYQWAGDYFNNPDVPEDREKEKSVPKPHTGTASKPKKAASKAKKTDKKDKEKQESDSNGYEQMTLGV